MSYSRDVEEAGVSERALAKPSGLWGLSENSKISTGLVIGGGVMAAGGGVVVTVGAGAAVLGGPLTGGLLLAWGIATVGLGVTGFATGGAQTLAQTAMVLEPLQSPAGLFATPICGVIATPKFPLMECIEYSGFDAWYELARQQLGGIGAHLDGSVEGGSGWRENLSLFDAGEENASDYSLLDSDAPGSPAPAAPSQPQTAFERYQEWEREKERSDYERTIRDIDKAGKEPGVRDDRPFVHDGGKGHVVT